MFKGIISCGIKPRLQNKLFLKMFSSKENIFTYLNERNLVSSISHQELLNQETNIQEFLKENPRMYIGFDPTAECLHLGNLIGILTAIRFGAFGIEPVLVMGGATGQIGDPSGKNKERPLMHKDTLNNNLCNIQDNIKCIMKSINEYSDFNKFCQEKSEINKKLIKKLNKENKSDSSSSNSDDDLIEDKLKKISSEHLLKNASNTHNIEKYFPTDLSKMKNKNQDINFTNFTFNNEYFNYKIVDNLDFYKNLNIIDFLRDVGTNLRMGPLLSRETVKNRVNSKEGLSLTEFMYQTFQGFDFLKLYEKYNVKIQIGGSDQWGNMLAGYELIKKMKNVEVVNMTFPLMTTSTGQKFGKSEGNALFINPKLTPINCIYQYFYNITDSDLLKMFYAFTFIEKKEIIEMLNKHNQKPELRIGQKLLAEKVVGLLFSHEEAIKCAKNSQAHHMNFSSFSSEKGKSVGDLDELFKQCHITEISEECLNSLTVSGLCVTKKVMKTKADCRRLIQSGSLFINNNKINDDVTLKKEMLLGGKYLILKTGKKHTHIFEVKNTHIPISENKLTSNI